MDHGKTQKTEKNSEKQGGKAGVKSDNSLLSEGLENNVGSVHKPQYMLQIAFKKTGYLLSWASGACFLESSDVVAWRIEESQYHEYDSSYNQDYTYDLIGIRRSLGSATHAKVFLVQ
jgi:hypothetical protein